MAQIRVQFALDQIVHANLEDFVGPYQERGVPKAAVYAKLLMLGIQVARDLDLDLVDELEVARTQMETLTIDTEDDRKADLIEAVMREVAKSDDQELEEWKQRTNNNEQREIDKLPW